MSKLIYHRPRRQDLPIQFRRYRTVMANGKYDWLLHNLVHNHDFDAHVAAIPYCELRGETYESAGNPDSERIRG